MTTMTIAGVITIMTTMKTMTVITIMATTMTMKMMTTPDLRPSVTSG